MTLGSGFTATASSLGDVSRVGSVRRRLPIVPRCAPRVGTVQEPEGAEPPSCLAADNHRDVAGLGERRKAGVAQTCGYEIGLEDFGVDALHLVACRA